jgi:acetyl-CoA synthetase
MFSDASNYNDARRSFLWRIPDRYNLAVDVCDRPCAQGCQDALLIVDKNLRVRRHSFDELSRLSSKFANMLLAKGHKPGDRILVLLKGSLEAAVAHLGILKAGMITVPVFSTLTTEAIRSRLELSGATGAVATAKNVDNVRAAQLECPQLREAYLVDGQDEDADNRRLLELLGPSSDSFQGTASLPDDPAILAFTSGSDAAPKGVLHAHRMMIGTVPALEVAQDRPRPGEVTWAPADWGWLMGLNGALASWWFGTTVVVYTGPAFTPELAYSILDRAGVTHAALPVTALRMMQLTPGGPRRFALRTISTSGEAVGCDTFEWVRGRFGLDLHDLYAMTECVSLSANGYLSPPRAGSLGRPLPGHDVQIVEEDGQTVDLGQEGLISLKLPDPAVFLGYWQDEEATKARFIKDRFVTSDVARQDENGYLWYVGRSDDVIKSAGYRISPTVVEDAAKKHPAVELAAAVGVPDAVRGQAVKLWIQLRPRERPSKDLERDIRDVVRSTLSVHEWPREIAFDAALPVTATGKVARRDLRARA